MGWRDRIAKAIVEGGKGATVPTMRLPIATIEHGESAMPGGKLTWPGAEDLIRDYANRPTPFPPISVVAPERPGGKWMIEDGSHRLEAAKLRGDTHIQAELPSQEELARLGITLPTERPR